MKVIPKPINIKHGWGKNCVAPLLAVYISFEQPQSKAIDARALRQCAYRASRPVEDLR